MVLVEVGVGSENINWKPGIAELRAVISAWIYLEPAVEWCAGLIRPLMWGRDGVEQSQQYHTE